MKKQTKEHIKYMALGFFGLLFVKYIVVGLDDWNSVLHEGRIEDKDTPLFFRQGLIFSERDLQNGLIKNA